MKTKWAPGYAPLPGPKCIRCRKSSRRAKFDPYCSFHCREWANLERVNVYLENLRSGSR